MRGFLLTNEKGPHDASLFYSDASKHSRMFLVISTDKLNCLVPAAHDHHASKCRSSQQQEENTGIDRCTGHVTPIHGRLPITSISLFIRIAGRARSIAGLPNLTTRSEVTPTRNATITRISIPTGASLA